jgi:dinuclear metal center YbgI/SA1388 family protein
MTTRLELEIYIDQLLRCGIYDDFTVNGLQIEGKSTVQRIVTGVSPSKRLFAAALRWKADAIILHHGLFWKRGTPHPLTLKGVLRDRVAQILSRDVNLFAYHLPLDGDEEFGNNASISRALGLEEVRIIPESGTDFPLIAIGRLPTPTTFREFCRLADKSLGHKGRGLQHGSKPVSTVAVVTGAGSDCWIDAAANGADVLITGEIHESNVREAEEAGIHLYAGGHYNTEKWGVRALGEHLAQKFDLQVRFIDIPNPI